MAKIHLIAIGGSVMHNLALALVENGHQVSGSDDQIFEPARTKLLNKGLLPDQDGWFPDKISTEIDFIILGMHAKNDNPELLAAIQLGIPIYSFPEYVQKAYKEKFQIVVIGSHGKTTTTSMIMHIFKELGLDFDYLVGSQLEGFSNMVRISEAPFAIIEGDEYLSSCLDSQPKFMHYSPQILVITGIAWDHYNVFPTFDSYLDAFRKRLMTGLAATQIAYCQNDAVLRELIISTARPESLHPYQAAPNIISPTETQLIYENERYPLQIFGNHNLENLQAAITVSILLNHDLKNVYLALTSFKGASKRLERIYEDANRIIYRDFAHAPSKLKASLLAVREKHPGKKLLAVVELHTYSSLNPEFLPHYAQTASPVDKLMVYYDQKAMEIKRMEQIDPLLLLKAFEHPDISIINDAMQLKALLVSSISQYEVIVFAGSGNFGKLDLANFYQSPF
ncbi:MAG: peptidoglycan synthetase [Saprospiraceae bacterium]|nr:peptidoglycan synthetase [Saprospiraceae bacterium]